MNTLVITALRPSTITHWISIDWVTSESVALFAILATWLSRATSTIVVELRTGSTDEEWCNIVDPSPEDWRVVNGNFPQGMGAGHSLSSYLQSLNQEEGLLAEIEFRRNHLQSMRDWPQDDSRIRVYRYEEIMGNEEDVFANIAELYGLPLPHRKLARFFANKYSAKKRTGRTQHIRNPSPGQWQNVFTPRVSTFFREQYGDLLERYGYA